MKIKLSFHLLRRFAEPVLTLPRYVKRPLVAATDACLCLLSVWLAFYLRTGELFAFWEESFLFLSSPMALASAASVLLAIPVFIALGLYRVIFRYNGLVAMTAMARAILVYGLFFASIFTLYGVVGVPRTVGLIQPLLLLVLLGASRAAARLLFGSSNRSHIRTSIVPQVLIYGAGSAGRQLASAMASSEAMHVVGFLDDDIHLQNNALNGLPIYDPANLDKLMLEVLVTDVLLALPSTSRNRRNSILESLSPHKVTVRTLPGLSDIATGKISLSDVRELDIDDLLGREPVKPNDRLLNLNSHNKTVLVTGAGGSIGSELCRQILETKPRQLLLVEKSEFALYQIHQELLTILVDGREVEIIPLLASVCDEARMQEIMCTWKPHTLYHAAAYKHVPLVEHNPAEGVRNNVWGTRVCAEVAMRNKVSNFVLISTDKAVRPTNIMGATKRLAEMVLQAFSDSMPVVNTVVAEVASPQTVFSIVRFGNVLGSSGSVVPLFREQIKNGGPITLTHTDITRYFMTIPEAAQLVMQAGAMGGGGDVFVLDMGQPVKIKDLARRMVELSGLTVKDEHRSEGDIEFAVTGLRPGEKLYEELLIGEDPQTTEHPRIMKAHEQFLKWNELESRLSTLNIAVGVNDVPMIRRLLQHSVSGYQPSGDVVDWVHLAKQRHATACEP
jgi:FlaA1/EpsC-like NDP-sugar epimerase